MADRQPLSSPSQAPSSPATSAATIATASSASTAIASSSHALEPIGTADIEAIQAPDVNDPATYKRSQDPNWKNTGLDDIYATWDKLVPVEELPKFEEMGQFLVDHDPQTARELEKVFVLLRRKFKCLPKKSQMKFVLGLLVQKGSAPKGMALEKLLVKKAQKSQSGVLVVTVLTSPYPAVGGKKQKFSCQWNCYYCPNEPDQPRSYLHDEPSVLRANRNDFDPVLQFCDRCVTLAMNGHPVDKIELLVLGGTWASYPVEYQENFIRDLFYAANTFFDREKRERHSLDDEKLENETAAVKIIGITLETRPDCITPEELRRFRRYGCTRVQLGIQHTNDAILKKINRGHTLAEAVQALKLLRDCCYKTDIHLMPNLPGSDPEQDRAMFEYVLHSPDLQADQWKIYPCEITPWTVIKKWYDEGSYVPYAEDKLIELLMDVKTQVHPWIRLNRVIRDIPSQYILGGMDEPNLRQVINNKMIARGTPCKCIRCREVKTDDVAIASAECVIREYEANEGDEYFISFETPDRSKICGFARLRLSQTPGGGVFPELEGAALIRELHVYGQLVAALSKKKKAASAPATDAESSHAQHTGFGTQLMMKAEEIARSHGYKKMAVIAGVGVRNFYRRLGFEVEGDGELMIKHLDELRAPSVWSKVNCFVSKNLGQELSISQLSAIAIAGVITLSTVTAAVIRRR
ncbi:Elongator complex protein [Phytophthora megakarya]|uniref:tRNA carboxymethyluridine synthase n=1 Tax=Phytophthora megakarya TaxID=4795 RepID=A0A225WDX9_9STRA|nr:Elongator complex protein [Phytophthora megakarya]